MFNTSTREWTMASYDGSFGWVIENIDQEDVLEMTIREIYSWVDQVIENVIDFTLAGDDRLKDDDEAMEAAIADVKREREELFAYILDWATSNEQ